MIQKPREPAPGTSPISFEEIRLYDQLKVEGLINQLTRLIGDRIHFQIDIVDAYTNSELSQDAFKQLLYGLMQTVREIEWAKQELLEATK